MIEMVPAGYKWIFILIALAKLALLTRGIAPAEKLRFLEFLDTAPDSYMTREMVAMIDPLDDAGYAIYAEAKTLDPPGDKLGEASFRVLTSERVFGHFLTLNPSILKAIEWREANRGRAATTPAAAPAPPMPPPATRPPYGSDIPDRFLQRGQGR